MAPPAAASRSQRSWDQYEGVIRLAAENKITKENAFDHNFIDEMGALVQEERQVAGTAFCFPKAGFALGAGTKIYEKRVDAIEAQIYSTCSGKAGPWVCGEEHKALPAGCLRGTAHRSKAWTLKHLRASTNKVATNPNRVCRPEC